MEVAVINLGWNLVNELFPPTCSGVFWNLRVSFFFLVKYFKSKLFFSAFLAEIRPQEFMVFELAVSALGICRFLALHFYLLISSHSSWTPSSSVHHRFSFLGDPVCLYQTWSRHVISDGQCCWCLDILPSLTSNTLALPIILAPLLPYSFFFSFGESREWLHFKPEADSHGQFISKVIFLLQPLFFGDGSQLVRILSKMSIKKKSL